MSYKLTYRTSPKNIEVILPRVSYGNSVSTNIRSNIVDVLTNKMDGYNGRIHTLSLTSASVSFTEAALLVEFLHKYSGKKITFDDPKLKKRYYGVITNWNFTVVNESFKPLTSAETTDYRRLVDTIVNRSLDYDISSFLNRYLNISNGVIRAYRYDISISITCNSMESLDV